MKNLSLKKKLIIGVSIGCFLIVIGLIFVCVHFKINGKKIVNIQYNENYLDKGAYLEVFGKKYPNLIKTDNPVDPSKIGEYTVSYTYKIGFIELKKERKVKVVDTTKPTIELNGEAKITMCPNSNYEEQGYSATDNYDGDLTSQVKIKEVEEGIEYSVEDSSGNKATTIREIKKEDNIKPTIYLVGGSTIYVQKGSNYIEYGYKVEDNCDIDLENNVEISGEVDSNNVGTYEVTYTVKDQSENVSQAVRKVIVNEVSSSNISIPGVIYLTFDDGPSVSGSTDKILNVLKQEGVKATFFVTGSGSDALIKREFDEGHSIGLHTNNHQYSYVYSSVENYFNDLNEITERVKRITGVDTKVMRFPGGSNNTVSNNYNYGIMNILKEQVVNRGYNYFDWNVDSNDAWTCAKSNVLDKRGCVYNNVISTLSKNRANVVLMHDIKNYTADALQDIIRFAKQNGYTFDVLTKDTRPVRFG